MEPLSLGFIISAFIAGLVMFLAPCTLPLVPAYLGFISGVSAEELKDPERAPDARRKIFYNGVAFTLGFSAVFILFGTLAGLIGAELSPYRVWLTRIGGVLVILFGVFLLGAYKLPIFQKFFASTSLRIPSWLSVGNPTSSLIIGGSFAIGWTPCVGPILGSILVLASASATALQGAFLLTVFSLGMAIPFLVLASAYSAMTSYIEKMSIYLHVISILGGIFLIGLGVLLVMDNFNILIQYAFQWFGEYEAILQFL